MPPMPPGPPGPPPAPAALDSSLISATRASVVSISPAMDAAFCSARRVTFAGSITPILTISPYSCFRVEPVVLVLGLADFADHDGAFKAGVVRDLASGLFESALHDADADELIAIGLDLVNGGDGAEQGRAAAGNNAFLYGCLGRVHGVFYSSLLFLQLGFSRSANLDHRYTAHELS